MGKPDLVEYAHFPDEGHGYDYSKRVAAYPFLAKHLGLDVSKAFNADGSLNEDTIEIEDTQTLYCFDEKNPFPAHGIKTNDDVVW